MQTIYLSVPKSLSSSGLPAFDLCPIIVAMNAHFLSARTNPSPVPRASVFGSHSDRRQDCYPPIAGHFHSQNSFRACRQQTAATSLHLIWLMQIQGTLPPWSTLARGLHTVFDSAGSESESAHTVWRRRTLPGPMGPFRCLSILGRVGYVFPGAQSVAYEVLAPAYSKT
jgi:hypothetical protein